MKFKDKVALVTGAAQGIGFEICSQLASQGAIVVLNDIESELAEHAANNINKELPGSCLSFSGDSGDTSFITSMIETTVSRFGQLDVVIANAGITLFGDFFTYSPQDFNRVMAVNLAGTFFLAQAAAIQMRNQKNGGTILFTSSVTGHQAHKDLAAYSMSKAAIEMLARNLVIELSPYGINVNAIAPGATLTERTLSDPDYIKTWSKLTPMGRPATVNDIAGIALFMVSEEAKHITGQTIVVDGGWSCISPSPF